MTAVENQNRTVANYCLTHHGGVTGGDMLGDNGGDVRHGRASSLAYPRFPLCNLNYNEYYCLASEVGMHTHTATRAAAAPRAP